MKRVAHLPMYDQPEVRWANDALWGAIAARLRQAGLDDIPRSLSRELSHHEGWTHPGLLLGQSCGYPARRKFRDAFKIVAAPVHDAPGCDGARHVSFILVPARSPARALADLRGARFALNSWDSNTGMNLARLLFAPLARDGRFFGDIVESGGHAASFMLVARGEADATAIDCVTYAILSRARPQFAAATRIIAQSAACRTLPYVTALATSDACVRLLAEAMADAFADPALAACRAALCLSGIALAHEIDYDLVLDYENQASELGYPVLR